MVFITATIGVEYVLIRLSREFSQPFHVNEKAFMKYSRIPDLSYAVTKDGYSQLHACLVCKASNHKIKKSNSIITFILFVLLFYNFPILFFSQAVILTVLYSVNTIRAARWNLFSASSSVLLDSIIFPLVMWVLTPFDWSNWKFQKMLKDWVNHKCSSADKSFLFHVFLEFVEGIKRWIAS